MNWITIEVFDGAVPATGWAQAWHDRLVEAAVTGGAVFWDEHAHSWGVVLEFTFEDERRRDAFRKAPVLLAALDAAREPLACVLVYPHRGGVDGIRQPRRPRPARGGGTAELPLPDPDAGRFVACTAEPPATRAVSEPA